MKTKKNVFPHAAARLHSMVTTNIKQSTLVIKSLALLSGLHSTPDPHPVRCVPL